MELRWLEDFMALARTRHFSRAADSRHVSQPTFSRRIRLLEEAMNATLIDRQALPLALTQAGEEFLGFCKEVTGALNATQERIQALEHSNDTSLRVAATQSLFAQFLPAWRERHGLMHSITPLLNATSWVGAEYLNALLQHQCELAMIYWHDQLPFTRTLDERFRVLDLAGERLIPVSLARSGQPLFALPGTQEHPVPMMAYHPRSLLAPLVTDLLQRVAPSLHVTALNENVQSASILSLVEQGYGMGWLPERVAARTLEAGTLARAGDECFDATLSIRLIALAEPGHPELDALWSRLENA